MSDKVSLVRVLTAATGTSTPITLGARYSDLFMTPAEAGAVDGRTYTWLIVDGSNFELVKGAYHSSGTTMDRTKVLVSRIAGTLGTSKISLSGTAQVRIVEAAVDMDGIRGTRVVGGTTDVIASTDHGFAIAYSNATGVAASLAQAGTAGLDDGWKTFVKNTGAGILTITPATSTINGAASLALANSLGAMIWSDGTNYHAFVMPVSQPLLVARNLGDLGSAALALTNLGLDTGAIRTDISQSLSTAQQGVALKNIGAAQLVIKNGKIVESHASNAVTYSIKTLAGTNPSASDPVTVMFPDSSQIVQTAACSITVPSTGTLGAPSGIPFHVWCPLINDSGTLRIGVRNCTDTSGSSPFPCSGVLSSTIVTTPNSAKVTYTDVAVTNKPYVIAGYASYESGLATAGTWNVSPDWIVAYVPGMAGPGQYTGNSVQYSSRTTLINTTASFVDSALTGGITLSSKANLVDTYFAGSGQVDTAAHVLFVALRRSGSVIGEQQRFGYGAANMIGPVGGSWTDAPGTLTPSYVVSTSLDSVGATGYFMSTVGGGVLKLAEVMA